MAEDCCVMCGYVFAPDQPVERTWDILEGGRLRQARLLDVPVDKEYHVCSACLLVEAEAGAGEQAELFGEAKEEQHG